MPSLWACLFCTAALQVSAPATNDPTPATSDTGMTQEGAETLTDGADTQPVLALSDSAQNEVALEGTPLFTRAETYAAFHGDVEAAQVRELRSGADLDAVMDSLVAYYKDDALADAHIAYAALVAQQFPEFLDDVRAVADYYGPQVAVEALTHDPIYVTGFTGADDASETVFSALAQDSERISLAADRYREAAYDLQAQSWAQRRARDRQDRLSSLETASSRVSADFTLGDQVRAAPNDPELAAATRVQAPATMRNTGAVSALLLRQREDMAQQASPILTLTVGEAQLAPDEHRIGQILTVAALQAIRDTDPATLDAMLSDPRVERCITWARLQLTQCVAAGHFKYEDSFCISQHALHDVALCLSASREVQSNTNASTVSN